MASSSNRRPRTTLIVAIAMTASAASPVHGQQAARANDFPTVERVLYVEACTRDHADRPRTEMLYKCSCVIDALAAEMTFDEFVDASTAFYGGQIAGERGANLRENSAGAELAKRFRSAQREAQARCMVQP